MYFITFYEIFCIRSLSQNDKAAKKTMECSIILWEFDGGIVQGYSFRGKSLAGNCSLKNFMAVNVQGELYKSNCLRAKLKKAIALPGGSSRAIVRRLVVQGKIIQG